MGFEPQSPGVKLEYLRKPQADLLIDDAHDSIRRPPRNIGHRVQCAGNRCAKEDLTGPQPEEWKRRRPRIGAGCRAAPQGLPSRPRPPTRFRRPWRVPDLKRLPEGELEQLGAVAANGIDGLGDADAQGPEGRQPAGQEARREP